jgi:hypothetical protein
VAGQAGLISGLLRLGLQGNAVTKQGDTALHLAAKAGHVEVRALYEERWWRQQDWGLTG